ncbi:RNA polymerase sigma factor [Paludisphaera rhizosphaerae]|uniref:RNA polymerase sigma factor n=1 Tax=Paludisphaera rhizosphaerae TaxID=2711216 RepID=UPI001C6EE161|nr:sigma factor [Paludisphaera rhizosphaerae]
MVAATGSGAPQGRENLEALCEAYWYPLYAYARRRGHSPEQAQDLTQDFFAYVLEKDLLARADPHRGRFRSFLLGVYTHYLANRHDYEHALKRGGGRSALSIDATTAEGRYDRDLVLNLTPERIFDRSWALTLLGRVLDELRREYEDSGREAVFETLSVNLTEGPQAESYAAIGRRLGVSEGSARVAVHRLRRRYAHLLRCEIAATVEDSEEIEDEIRALFAALQA